MGCDYRLSRRRFVAGIAGGSMLGIAGCLSGSPAPIDRVKVTQTNTLVHVNPAARFHGVNVINPDDSLLREFWHHDGQQVFELTTPDRAGTYEAVAHVRNEEAVQTVEFEVSSAQAEGM